MPDLGLRSNKPTHYLLDYDDFKIFNFIEPKTLKKAFSLTPELEAELLGTRTSRKM